MAKERILVALQGGEPDDAPLEAACALAPVFEADLRGVFVEPDPAHYMLWTGPGAAGASVVSTAIDAVREEADKACRDAATRFSKTIEGGPCDKDGASFRRITDSPAEAAQQARLVRLLVACPEAAAGRGPLADFVAACLVEEAAPLYVPRKGATPPKTICVAWDGSKEAARAAFAAEPLFDQADKVVILHSDRNLDYHDRAASAPNRLKNWLSAHGVECETREVDTSGSLGEAMLEAAGECDLLVAGAYGHSRVSQFIFGGVTRTLLGAMDGPSVLMAH
ncbi:universal stress protein [Marinicauda salina]|uniref:Universal stress protein n=1 Tax=Marinicauda salina TaxID=2135793 RepID=A0A2U2BUD7_9PROT|nr:universal stress protein [Marinicauda salina]PWE17612.1 universal stress protein [Marinicauda salina]